VSGGTEIPVRVTKVTMVAHRIKRFRFERLDGLPMPYFSGGAHTIVSMNDNGHLRRNAYSLMSPPHDCSGYEISVLHVEESRGGSTFMHEKVREGDEMRVSHPVNLFQPDWRGRKHLLIAGFPARAQISSCIMRFERATVGPIVRTSSRVMARE
jgi:dimethylamine monooxygenase subunit B